MAESITLEDIVQNGELNLKKFFEMQFLEGAPIYRFVDDMNVNWSEISQNMGRSPEECRAQYQYLLDSLFDRAEFKTQDREELYMLITMKQIEIKKNTSQIPDEDIKQIQESYFPDYSSEVIRMEIQAALNNFREFLDEQKM